MTATDGKLTVRPKGGKPLLGHMDKANGRIQFTPQFPLLTGETYEAVFTDSTGQQIVLEHTIAIKAPAPQVKAIYPSTSLLPANHLKFYLHFTEPMQQGKIYGYFKLIDLTSGLPVEKPFRETELWSANGKRLTLPLLPALRFSFWPSNKTPANSLPPPPRTAPSLTFATGKSPHPAPAPARLCSLLSPRRSIQLCCRISSP